MKGKLVTNLLKTLPVLSNNNTIGKARIMDKSSQPHGGNMLAITNVPELVKMVSTTGANRTPSTNHMTATQKISFSFDKNNAPEVWTFC